MLPLLALGVHELQRWLLLCLLCVCTHCPWLPGPVYLARSAPGDFVVQARQVACASVFCNNAIRIRYGKTVVTIDASQK